MTKATTAQSAGGLGGYLRDTRAEMRKVVWPTRDQAINLTLVVLLITFLMTAILGGLDFIFGQLLNYLIGVGS